MTGRARSAAVRVGRCLIGGAVLALAGCTFRPMILGAESTRAGEKEVIVVSLRSEDAETIKRRNIYFSVVVYECGGARDGYPARPYIDGVSASSFRFPVAGERTLVTSRVPRRIYDSYQNPCIFLRGGSYLMGEIESASAPVVPSATGSGQSPEPAPAAPPPGDS
jgi:hypothetical protein